MGFLSKLKDIASDKFKEHQTNQAEKRQFAKEEKAFQKMVEKRAIQESRLAHAEERIGFEKDKQKVKFKQRLEAIRNPVDNPLGGLVAALQTGEPPQRKLTKKQRKAQKRAQRPTFDTFNPVVGNGALRRQEPREGKKGQRRRPPPTNFDAGFDVPGINLI